MATLGTKNGIYNVRFRFDGKQYKKSLKTRDEDEAQAAVNSVELTIHRLHTGQVLVPYGVDAGDFIVSGGTLTTAPNAKKAIRLDLLVNEYLKAQAGKADSSVATERIHLGNLCKQLGAKSKLPCDRICHADLERYLRARLEQGRAGATVKKERVTIVQLFAWARSHGYIDRVPTDELPQIKEGAERPPFRTMGEIESILERGGLDEDEQIKLWECLFLDPQEIAGLLAIVRSNAEDDYAPLLHVIPAYTGIRRGELIRLRWSDVDFQNMFLVARSRKQSRQRVETTRRIDLHHELAAELDAWRAQRPRGQYVVCDRDLEILDRDVANRAFWQPMRRTDWDLKPGGRRNRFKVGFHTYRHSFASNLAAAGVDQRVIDEWMGHQTEAMRKRYRHLFPKKRQEAIRSFSLAP